MAQLVSQLAVLPDHSFLRNAAPDSWTDVVKVTTAGTAVYLNVPLTPNGTTYAKRVVFGATGNFCVRLNAAVAGTQAAAFADTRTGQVGSGAGGEINPAGFYLKNVLELSFDAATSGTYISCTFYA